MTPQLPERRSCVTQCALGLPSRPSSARPDHAALPKPGGRSGPYKASHPRPAPPNSKVFFTWPEPCKEYQGSYERMKTEFLTTADKHGLLSPAVEECLARLSTALQSTGAAELSLDYNGPEQLLQLRGQSWGRFSKAMAFMLNRTVDPSKLTHTVGSSDLMQSMLTAIFCDRGSKYPFRVGDHYASLACCTKRQSKLGKTMDCMCLWELYPAAAIDAVRAKVAAKVVRPIGMHVTELSMLLAQDQQLYMDRGYWCRGGGSRSSTYSPSIFSSIPPVDLAVWWLSRFAADMETNPTEAHALSTDSAGNAHIECPCTWDFREHDEDFFGYD